mgnify:CR=1 FL=1
MYKVVKLLFVKLIGVVIVFGFSSLSSAENLISHPDVQAQRDCFRQNFSDFATWRSSMANKYQRKLKSEKKVARALARFDRSFNEEKFLTYQNTLTCQTFDYFVDGHKVRGFIVKPKTAAEQKLPVLVYNRGGNGNFGAVVFGSMMRNLFPVAKAGFVIIGSQYRGTFNRKRIKAFDDQFGGDDVNDVLALLDYIPEIAGADPEKIGMFGASRGGMQTYLALKQTKQAQQVKAVAVIAGVTDLAVGLQQRPAMEKVYKKRIPNYENNKTAELEKRSVLHWLDELPNNVPMLLLHGTADKRVSVEHSKTLAAALDEAGLPNKLVIYPDDNHGLTANKTKATQEIVTWFKKYL